MFPWISDLADFERLFDNYGFMFLAYILRWHNCDLLMRNEVPIPGIGASSSYIFRNEKNTQKSCSRISFLFQVLKFFTKVRVCSGTLLFYLALTTFATISFKYCIPTCVFLAIFLESFKQNYQNMHSHCAKSGFLLGWNLHTRFHSQVDERLYIKLDVLVPFLVNKLLLKGVLNFLFSAWTPKVFRRQPRFLKYILF